MRTRRRLMLRFLWAGLLGGLTACSAYTITPDPEEAKLEPVAAHLQERLRPCGGPDAYECTKAAACDVRFPAPGQPTSVTYRSIGGFDTFEVIVDPRGEVTEVRRYEKTSSGTMEVSSDVCSG